MRNQSPAQHFNKACYIGNLDRIKILVQMHGERLLESVDVIDAVIELSTSARALEAVSWLVGESGYTFDLAKNDNESLRAAARKGHFEVVKWLVEHAPQRLDVTAKHNAILQNAASDGHLEMIKWLFNTAHDAAAKNPVWSSQRVPKVQLDVLSNFALQNAAENGHLEVVKWFLTDCPQPTNLTTWNNFALRQAVTHQHFELARWLLNESGRAAEIIRAGCVDKILDDFLEPSLRQLCDLAEPKRMQLAAVLLHAQDVAAIQRPLSAEALAKLKAAERTLSEFDLKLRLMCSSAICRKACDTGMIHSFEQLETLLESGKNSLLTTQSL